METSTSMVRGNKFLWMLIFSIFAVPFSGAFGSNPWEIQSNVLYLCLAILSVFGISKLSEKQRWVVLKAMVALVIFQGVLVIAQYFNHDPLFNYKKDITKDLPFGFSCSPNQSGLFFAVTLPTVAAVFPYALPLSLFGLLCAKTTSAVIGATTGILLLSFGLKKARKVAAIGIILISILFFAKFEHLSTPAVCERLSVYSHSIVGVVSGRIQLFIDGKVYTAKCNPLFGYGFGNFKKLSPHNQTGYIDAAHRYYEAHNDYIQIFFEFGYLGLAITCMFLWDLVYGFIQAKKTKMLVITFSCITAQLVSALGIFTIYTATSGMLLLIMYGLYKGEINARGN